MEIVGHIWFATFCSVLALKPGPLRIRGALSRGPWHTVERPNALIIRGVSLVIAVIVWINLALILTGRPPILH
jgi:hypothetical protein